MIYLRSDISGYTEELSGIKNDIPSVSIAARSRCKNRGVQFAQVICRP